MLQEKENQKSKMMLDALALAEQLAKEAKTKTKGKILGDIQTSFLENKINNAERKVKENEIAESKNSWTSVGEDKSLEFNAKKLAVTCDAHTSLTTEKYFEEFKSKIPLVTTAWTQTK